ncbi:MAG: aspartate carbamoyltransferase [Candidatus Promineifilaceae bacterium]
MLVALLALASCTASSTDLQEEVAERGAEVMPFDLERTTHVFEKLGNGGLQQVLADDGDAEQVRLIREHLAEEAERFQNGDFHDPAMIHGDDMAGLHELVTGADQLTIIYSEIETGAQILYSANDNSLINALHAWFDQQVSDHGSHAEGH